MPTATATAKSWAGTCAPIPPTRRAELRPLVTHDPDWSDLHLRTVPHRNAAIKEPLRLHPGIPAEVPRITPPEGARVDDVSLPGHTDFWMPADTIGRGEVAARLDPSIEGRGRSRADDISDPQSITRTLSTLCWSAGTCGPKYSSSRPPVRLFHCARRTVSDRGISRLCAVPPIVVPHTHAHLPPPSQWPR